MFVPRYEEKIKRTYLKCLGGRLVKGNHFLNVGLMWSMLLFSLSDRRESQGPMSDSSPITNPVPARLSNGDTDTKMPPSTGLPETQHLCEKGQKQSKEGVLSVQGKMLLERNSRNLRRPASQAPGWLERGGRKGQLPLPTNVQTSQAQDRKVLWPSGG